MAFTDADIGSICPFCQKGELVKSPKTGKIFCSEKCWLNNKPKPAPAQPANVDRFIKNLDKTKEEQKWKEISTGKVRHHFAVEAYKMGKPLDLQTKLEIKTWTDFVMRGE